MCVVPASIAPETDAQRRVARDNWSITLPADGGDAILHILVALAMGFDPAGYRLRDGDGLYD